MPLTRLVLDLAIGRSPKMRRVLKYWAGTALLYLFCGCLVWHQITTGSVELVGGTAVIGFGAAGLAIFYILLRSRNVLRLEYWQLTCCQAVFAVLYDLALYIVLGPIRAGMLIGLPVVILFCAFSLRPIQTRCLSAFAIAAMAIVLSVLHELRPLTHPVYVETVFFLQASIGILAVAFVTGQLNKLQSTLRQQKDEMERAGATIRKLAITDELTKLANRHHMKDLMAREETASNASSRVVSVAILDLDFFKKINDLYGHSAGDTVLRSFAESARETLRPSDVLARWGGEEFLLLMPETHLENAMAVVERIAQSIERLCLQDVAPQLKITFSAGVVQRAVGESFADAIRRSDRAMYAAKNNGRNRIISG